MAEALHNLRLRQNRRAMRRERIFHNREDPLESLGREEIRLRYRFWPETIVLIVNLLWVELNPVTLRSHPIMPNLQVLIALRYLATGSYQLCVGDTVRVSQATVSRVVRRVCLGLQRRLRQFVRFISTNAERQAVKQEFYRIASKCSNRRTICLYIKD